MDSTEITIFEKLNTEFESGEVTKDTANKARDIFNRNHIKAEKILTCMCNKVKRQVAAKKMLEWYEAST